MPDFYDYEDAELRMRLPVYLRSPKGDRFFKVNTRIYKNTEVELMAVTFKTEAGAERYRKQLNTRMEPREWKGVQSEVIRQGQSLFVPNGTEAIVRSYDIISGHVLLRYGLISQIDGRYLYVAMSGQKNLEPFEQVCKTIVSSIRLNNGPHQQPIKATRKVSGQMKRLDKVRLSAALDGLPHQIAFLRKPILAIAGQDQDLLGSGEADAGPIDQSLRKTAKSASMSADAAAHADALHKWASGLPDHNGAWAAPIWFVEGFLRGATLFGMDDE